MRERNPKGEFDEDAARDDAKADADASTFEGSADTTLCTSDCSGHDAGFEWAKENDVSDASDCSGQSDSFVEGCESYAAAIQAQVEEERRQHEAKDDDG